MKHSMTNKSQGNNTTLFYGICGEGLGHYSRAVFLISHLLANGYGVEIFTSRRVVTLCRKRFPECRVHSVPGMKMHYENNRLHLPKTTWNNCQSIGRGPKAFSLILKRARICKPVAFISDYEPLVAISGKMLGIPVIAFDHQQVTTECKLEIRGISSFHMGLLHFSNETTYPWPNLRIISSFFRPPLKKRRSGGERVLIPPVLRSEVLKSNSVTGDHILVYQTSRTMEILSEVLEKLPGEKKVYGAGKSWSGQKEKKFDEQEFIRDLATCRFAIVNGGHTTLSEAVFLGKPVICFPVKNQTEQEINGQYIAHLGYGEYYQIDGKGRAPDFSSFLKNEESYRKQVEEKGKSCGNQELVNVVLEYLGREQLKS